MFVHLICRNLGGHDLEDAAYVFHGKHAVVESVGQQVGTARSEFHAHIGTILAGDVAVEVKDGVVFYAHNVVLLYLVRNIQHAVGKLIGNGSVLAFYGIGFVLSAVFLGSNPVLHGKRATAQ